MCECVLGGGGEINKYELAHVLFCGHKLDTGSKADYILLTKINLAHAHRGNCCTRHWGITCNVLIESVL